MSDRLNKCQWFFADVVLEITVDGEERNVVHINTHLLRAASPNEAFEKARQLGKQQEDHYENSAGKKVNICFRGLAELLPIYEELTDGAEIWFKEKIGLSESDIRDMVAAKKDLSLFRKREKIDVPDYVPARVWEKLKDLGYPREEQK